MWGQLRVEPTAESHRQAAPGHALDHLGCQHASSAICGSSIRAADHLCASVALPYPPPHQGDPVSTVQDSKANGFSLSL